MTSQSPSESSIDPDHHDTGSSSDPAHEEPEEGAEDHPEAAPDPPDEPPTSTAGAITRFGQLAFYHACSTPIWKDRGLVALIAALVYIPFLGSFGLWDPWETHYGEVGRQILERNDWISTWWGSLWQDAGGAREGSHFFSKPILLMWLMAMGMQVFGFNEFAIRIGVCCIAILGLVLVYSMGREVFGRRAGFLMAGVLGTSPFWAMLSRQAQTDMPFVGLMTIGLCFFMMAVFGKRRDDAPDTLAYIMTLGWVGVVSVPQLALILMGLSRWRGGANATMTVLAKRPLTTVSIGAGLMILFVVLFVVGIWRARRAVLNAPAGAGEEAEDKGGGETPRTPHEIVRRWSVGAICALWVPLALVLVAALIGSPNGRGALLALNGWFVWGPVQAALYLSCLGAAAYLLLTRPDLRRRQLWLFSFYVFIALATLAKGLLGFMLPGAVLFFYILLTREWRMLREVELARGIPIFIAISFPWYAAMLIRHNPGFWNRFFIHDHFKRLASGVHQVDEGSFEHFARWLGYGLFPYIGFVPAALARFFTTPETTDSRSDSSRATLMLLLWMVISFTLFTLSSTKFHHYIFPVMPTLAMVVALALDEALESELPEPWPLYLLGIGVTAVIGWDIAMDPQTMKNLYTYKYDRQWFVDSWSVTFRWALVITAGVSVVGMTAMLVRNRVVRRWALGAIFVASVGYAYYCLDVYMPNLSKTWSQKGLWDAYYEQCERVDGPPEAHRFKRYCAQPVVAFKLNWRGETFYSQNEVIPIRDDDDFDYFLEKLEPGTTFYAIMEMARYRGEFQRKLPARFRGKTCLTYNRNDRFVLAKAPCAPDDPQRLEKQP